MAEENAAAASSSSGPLGMFNAFVDPVGLAKAAQAKMFWLWPVITLAIIYVVFGYLMLPYTLQLIDSSMAQRAASQNIPVEKMETARNMAHMFGSVSLVMTPIIVIGALALGAWLVTLVGSMTGLRAKFRDVFSLMAACSLISSLQYVATYIVLKAKGDDITSPEQMMAPFGLDIFMQNIHGPLLALFNYFSIFTIWYIVMLGLSLAYLARSSKGQAFLAITPAWLVPLLFRMLGAMFSGSSNNS